MFIPSVKKIKEIVLVFVVCLVTASLMSCSSDDDGVDKKLSDSPSTYVVPVSASEFEILGTRVNIFEESAKSDVKIQELVAAKKNFPENYTHIVRDEFVYADLPDFTDRYSISDLKGLFIIEADQDDDDARVFLIVKNVIYIYNYIFNDGAWKIKQEFSGLDYFKMNLTEFDQDFIQASIDLPASAMETLITEYMSNGRTREEAEAKIAKEFAPLTMRVVYLDRSNHVLSMAIHYTGEKALDSDSYFKIEGDDDYWVVQNNFN